MEKSMNNDPLRDAFVRRDKRFGLLDRGIELARFAPGSRLLEPGCAGGEAMEHLSGMGFRELTGIDIDGGAIQKAAARLRGCRLLRGDACRLPLASGSFDGIYSEAAFALLTDKEAAAGEYHRVLKDGGRLLLNDFALRSRTGAQRVKGVPMLAGVQTRERYREIFEAAGFDCLYDREEFPEFIRIAISLSRAFGVSPAELGRYIVASFGGDEYVTDFFSHTQMSYCQMIFAKRK